MNIFETVVIAYHFYSFVLYITWPGLRYFLLQIWVHVDEGSVKSRRNLGTLVSVGGTFFWAPIAVGHYHFGAGSDARRAVKKPKNKGGVDVFDFAKPRLV